MASSLLYIRLLAASTISAVDFQCNPDISDECFDAGIRDSEISLLQTDIFVKQSAMAAEGVPAPQKNAAKNVIHSLLQSQEQSVRFPITFYHYAAAFLFIATVVVAWFTHSKLASSADETAFSDPRFKRHRYRFLLVWGICSSADWLQGPYVWELYHNYGYKQDDIDKLFVIGFVSSMIFGTFFGSLADTYGRKRMALAYCVLYFLSCALVHVSLFEVLVVGRVAGGIATSLLFSTFECWMVGEHNERQRFSSSLLRYMFSMMYFVYHLTAICSGLVAELAVESVPMRRISGHPYLHYGGCICTYDIAAAMLILAFPLICYGWEENYGDVAHQGPLAGMLGAGIDDDRSQEYRQSHLHHIRAGMQTLVSSWRVWMLGIAVAFFEAATYTFFMRWTPTLSFESTPRVPLGVVFSSLMMCCMLGSSAFSFVNPKCNPAYVVLFACIFSMCSLGYVVRQIGDIAALPMVFCCFCIFEVCVGLYFPAIGSLKSEVVPEENRAIIYNCYRIPLNIVVTSMLLAHLDLQRAFIANLVLVLVAAAILFIFIAAKRASIQSVIETKSCVSSIQADS
jgi:MFS family permease